MTAWGQAGHWLVGGVQLCRASLVSLEFYSSLSFSLLLVVAVS